MRIINSLIIAAGFGLMGQLAAAQIILQTPRPDVPEPDTTVIETVKPNAPIGSSGNLILVPRAGALLFAGFDNNSDYTIDKAEVQAGISAAFTRADKDASGKLSLVELEGWRVTALGSENAAPTNFAFAPNFARTVSREKFKTVLGALADKLDKDDQGDMDGRIFLADLLKSYSPPRARKDPENCLARVREERRRVEQQCRAQQRR